MYRHQLLGEPNRVILHRRVVVGIERQRFGLSVGIGQLPEKIAVLTNVIAARVAEQPGVNAVRVVVRRGLGRYGRRVARVARAGVDKFIGFVTLQLEILCRSVVNDTDSSVAVFGFDCDDIVAAQKYHRQSDCQADGQQRGGQYYRYFLHSRYPPLYELCVLPHKLNYSTV